MATPDITVIFDEHNGMFLFQPDFTEHWALAYENGRQIKIYKKGIFNLNFELEEITNTPLTGEWNLVAEVCNACRNKKLTKLVAL